MKVICTSPSFARYDAAPIDTLRQQGFELITLPADAPLSALAPHLADTVALIVAFTEVNDALLSLAPQLKIVCKHGVGVDNIDLDATRARGIYVTNVPDANKHAVADFAFALILNSARQITTAAIETRAGHWPRILPPTSTARSASSAWAISVSRWHCALKASICASSPSIFTPMTPSPPNTA